LAVSVGELDAMLGEGQTVEDGRSQSSSLSDDPVLTAPWSHRGTVEVAVLLRGGGWVKRRYFGLLTGMALTAPAHQWLIHEPGPLVSGLSGVECRLNWPSGCHT
jgi:hypothetical protein